MTATFLHDRMDEWGLPTALAKFVHRMEYSGSAGDALDKPLFGRQSYQGKSGKHDDESGSWCKHHGDAQQQHDEPKYVEQAVLKLLSNTGTLGALLVPTEIISRQT